ncbi:MAG: helix-turn-helix transcriptional regulator [Bdellovibrionales bacterium]|nr:helix-turn-helix transcriptional regulator [Bdellovibrionales bacterium]
MNQLTIKEAAKQVGRSAGWLSGVENHQSQSRLLPEEFDRIVRAYGGEAHRRKFGVWVAQVENRAWVPKISFKGSVLKYLRKKTGMRLKEVASRVDLSAGYLSDLENGKRALSDALRNKLMEVYGYSPSSFKNFASEDKRAGNIPIQYKLRTILYRLDDEKTERLFKVALEMSQTERNEKI